MVAYLNREAVYAEVRAVLEQAGRQSALGSPGEGCYQVALRASNLCTLQKCYRHLQPSCPNT